MPVPALFSAWRTVKPPLATTSGSSPDCVSHARITTTYAAKTQLLGARAFSLLCVMRHAVQMGTDDTQQFAIFVL
ncbi:hypothetical protein KCP73_12520 [Salmonella enterica subsp. enterica]|nr:hypothetical protein KCP73_12520 [Salmonella enterica subsp. enterica]